MTPPVTPLPLLELETVFEVKNFVEQSQINGVITVQAGTLLEVLEKIYKQFETLHTNQASAILYRGRNNLGKISRSDFVVGYRLIKRYHVEFTNPSEQAVFEIQQKHWHEIEEQCNTLASKYRSAKRDGNIFIVEKIGTL